MRILAAAAFCLTSLALPTGTRAENFSGFYAGVNAGAAFDTEHGARSIGPETPPTPSGATDDTKLPPSAANAAKALQGTRDGAAKTR